MPLTALPDWPGAAAAAQELLRQQDNGMAFTGLADEFAPGDVMQAYATQDAFIAMQSQQRRTAISGYKIAITTPVMR
ncbi:MAG: hypothetical protein WCO62_07355, partial [Betaproteobacteria bacterium]